jgi:hypothetical protein
VFSVTLGLIGFIMCQGIPSEVKWLNMILSLVGFDVCYQIVQTDYSYPMWLQEYALYVG